MPLFTVLINLSYGATKDSLISRIVCGQLIGASDWQRIETNRPRLLSAIAGRADFVSPGGEKFTSCFQVDQGIGFKGGCLEHAED